MVRLLPVSVLVIFILTVLLYQPFRATVAYKLNLTSDANSSCCKVEDVLRSSGSFDESANLAIFNNQVIDYPKTSLAQDYKNEMENANLASTMKPLDDPRVLGTTNSVGEEKWVEVSIGEQKLRAWEGNRVVMEFPISSGKWAPTPKGNFNIWYKTRRQKMSGGNRALGTYYYLPNVPHNMFFHQGYAIHGAYWHNNFGQPMSHGCVNSPLDKIGALFEWTGPVLPSGTNALRADASNPGTRVFVH